MRGDSEKVEKEGSLLWVFGNKMIKERKVVKIAKEGRKKKIEESKAFTFEFMKG